MKLVIHAGIHRTGTTSLQRVMAANRATLAAQGVCYPGEGPNHQALAWGLFRGEAQPRDVIGRVVGAREAGQTTVVLSGEDFAIHRDLGWLRTVAAHVDTRVVFYLRRQDHWLMSWYNQHVKWPFDRVKSRMDPATFLGTMEDFHWIDYERLLRRWSRVLGPERVAVGVLERGQVADVTADFLDRLGVVRSALERGEEWANDSLPVHLLEVARHMGLHDMKGGRRTKVLNALRDGLADKAPAGKVSTVYSPAERNRVLARFAASNRAVAQQYLGRETLFLEPAPAPDAPYWRFPDVDRDTLLEEWVGPVIRALVP